MRTNPEYYEFYGELIKSNIFLKRLVMILVGVNLLLAFIAYLGFSRPVETFLVKEGFAYATTPYGETRSVHEVRQFAQTFAKNLLEFNRENFNERIKLALQMCSTELEVLMYNTIKTSEIPKIVQNTPGTVKFNVEEIRVTQSDPFNAHVFGLQIFPGQQPIPLRFTLTINVVNRTDANPFGLRIINYTQEKT